MRPLSALSTNTGKQRKERKYKGSSKPDWVDSASWVSMSLKVRKHLIELEKKKLSGEATIWRGHDIKEEQLTSSLGINLPSVLINNIYPHLC